MKRRSWASLAAVLAIGATALVSAPAQGFGGVSCTITAPGAQPYSITVSNVNCSFAQGRIGYYTPGTGALMWNYTAVVSAGSSSTANAGPDLRSAGRHARVELGTLKSSWIGV